MPKLLTELEDNATVECPVNREMMILDRNFFKNDLRLTAIKIDDPRELPKYRKSYKNNLLQLRGISNIVKVFNKSQNQQAESQGSSPQPDILVLLKPDLTPDDDFARMEPEMKKYLDSRNGIEIVDYTLTLSYDFWRADQILSAILPNHLLHEVPSGFTMTGHVAHMNIRDEYLPYRFLIGQVILDKNPKVRTVINKLDSIDNQFRTFDMEILAGEADLHVEQHESDCKFQFDFDKVYWNSRLHTEHQRLIKLFVAGEAVCDVFAGVGPFAVPAGKKNVFVMANDLNYHSYTSLETNIRLNKVEKFVVPFNLDGREFIKQSLDKLYDFASEKKEIRILAKSRSKVHVNHPTEEVFPVPFQYQHYVMNLPDTAILFLDAFKGLYNDKAIVKSNIEDIRMPRIHVHCFHKWDPKDAEPADEVIFEALRKRISDALSFNIAIEELSFHFVRSVAPTKSMYCVNFILPTEVAFAS
ncbi:Met-10+ like-protein-domain-containing protein [Dipodascopsis uninucleata]